MSFDEQAAKAEAAARLGVPVAEIARVDDSPAGLVIVTADGQGYVHVPDDRPDGNGRTGLMYLTAPNPTYRGVFPVYANPEPVDEEAVRDTGIAAEADRAERDPGGDELAGLSKQELVDIAIGLGIDVKHNWSLQRLIEKIEDARQTPTPPADPDVDGPAEGGDE